ncbi:MAG: hypothetical protein C5B55_00785 [Blastocatellia bacterium]|nr:MAG: hypothetical protein C5B55_00785 [Blastocatellia bacterium]
MRSSRNFYAFVILTTLFAGTVSAKYDAQKTLHTPLRHSGDPLVLDAVPAPSGGIREEIPDAYKKRYQEWKAEFLSTDIGKAQWDLYAQHSRLLLTITVSRDNENGAGSGKYKWSSSGELIAATVTLGAKLDEGFPTDVYYPVMNALEPYERKKLISGNVLAAAKIAHEFGHVMKIGTIPEPLYHLQLRLAPVYNKILLSNGHNVDDPRLVDLASQMGGNPVQIWEDREYWGEANAMLYLRDRVAKESFHCRLFNKIKRSVEEYAKPYEERFTAIAKSEGVIYSCSWR